MAKRRYSSIFLANHEGSSLLPFHPKYRVLLAVIGASALLLSAFLWVAAQENSQQAPHDAVIEAQQTQTVPAERPEQQKTEHDRSDIFNAQNV
jgi:hypothetical protein